MTGNKKSGRKKMYSEEYGQIHLIMRKSSIEKLNEMAKLLSNNNRTQLITQTLERLISKYEQSK